MVVAWSNLFIYKEDIFTENFWHVHEFLSLFHTRVRLFEYFFAIEEKKLFKWEVLEPVKDEVRVDAEHFL